MTIVVLNVYLFLDSKGFSGMRVADTPLRYRFSLINVQIIVT